MRDSQVLRSIVILSTALVGACSDNGTGTQAGGGSGGSNPGAAGTGGETGGDPNPGGTTAGPSGGAGVIGGSPGSGGATGKGDATSIGGTTGGSSIGSGGMAAPGGASGTGAVTGTGGYMGGTIATVGGIATGGAAGGRGGAGGTTGVVAGATGGTGGPIGSGGIANSAGATARGGSSASGGSAGRSGSGGTTGPIPSGAAVAFPGALGFGNKATGGRGYGVYHVTNLNDTGAGSFRDAVSAENRIVVFDVGGYIVLKSPVSAKSNLTIAGQTAPGDGVGVMAGEVSYNASTNVITRYFRFRQGLLDPDSSKSGINLLDASNLIFDHISIEFAQWNNIDASNKNGTMTNITMQYSINANPTGQQFGAHTEQTGGFFTWYGNLWANAHGRMPLAKCNTQFVNNVVYNYQYAYCAGDTSGVFWHDLINNYFIAGPSTNSVGNYFYQLNAGQTFYVSGNLADTNKDGTLNGTDPGSPGGTTKASKANSTDTASLPTKSAADTYTTVLANAGCSLHRDEVDAQVVANVKSLGKSGQLWKDQTATGLGNSGYGTLNGGTAPVDTDKDGMPDAWETKYGLNPNDPADATGDFDKTGYTNVEKYINGIVDGLYP
jgi:hypothetical protein